MYETFCPITSIATVGGRGLLSSCMRLTLNSISDDLLLRRRKERPRQETYAMMPVLSDSLPML